MSVKLKIRITKEIIKESVVCLGIFPGSGLSTNCAFALAIRDIFPKAVVSSSHIVPFNEPLKFLGDWEAVVAGEKAFPTSYEMYAFIRRFDQSTLEERLDLPEQEFELDIPDWAIRKLAQQEVDFVQAVLNSPTLEIIPNETILC